jgi:hypothetical protein
MERRRLQDELLAVLQQAKRDRKLGEELIALLEKIRKNEKLESSEFLRIYKILWQDGPKVKYNNPDRWVTFDPTPESYFEN